MTESAHNDPGRLLQLGMAFMASKTLLSATELGVFSALARGPLDLEQLRTRLGLHPRSARDFFDALVSLGLLERHDGMYSNAADVDLFLDRAKPSYMGGILEMANARLYPFWGQLSEALRSGEPQNELRGGGPALFETLYGDPEALRGFLEAMSGVSRGSNMAIARQFPWDQYRTYADVGTAQGDLAVQIALANPSLTGIGFDLPPVQPIFHAYVARHGVDARLRFQAGDFFQDPLPQADVILMGHILHDWDLPTKRMLIAKAFEALPSGGALVIYEALIDDDRRTNTMGLLMSLNMLVETPGGFDYSGADCRLWLEEAGFGAIRVEPLMGPDAMVVAIRP